MPSVQWYGLCPEPFAISEKGLPGVWWYRTRHADTAQAVNEPTICADLAAAGFRDLKVDRIARKARAASARDAAVITVQGSLLRTAIEAADPSRLAEATKAVEQVMLTRFGDGPVEGEMRALLVTTTKPKT